MNAYELAKLMLDVTDCESSEYYQAGIMLRQQAERIAELEKAPTKYCPSENNEAYEKGFIDGMAKQRDSAVQRFVESNTHPVKQLSDEQINKIYLEKYDGHMGFLSPDEVRDFARAIIKEITE